MRKLVYYVAVSLDGYIAGPDNQFDFYPGSDTYTAWMCAQFPDSIPTAARPHIGMAVDAPNQEWDTVLMGRGTYAVGEANPFAHLKQYVFSSSLDPRIDPAIEVVPGDPVEFVRQLKRAEGLDVWLCGGGKLAATLSGEIDELIIKSYPVVAGAGIPAFTGAFDPTLFTPVRRKEFDSGNQVTWYARA
ncbi:dihydrofolate reductase family protein [Nocardia cyriacigeorgica]|uniref:dihydrofolate reductase family protein n=1 Tax=Nocardia cyriacigeorgica TaxID=135487 RepID=UPI0018943689|nr:dihydrofolate reductase family protein [Nocardia cyriacigeorgica]MBF6515884.1 dihydrofolate reductase family protein [Nocardia cyriacigeorgica]